ncbi:MAG: four-carbon acid sugar kinase family protein [Candidatus Njordarchaeum guaymaensis]
MVFKYVVVADDLTGANDTGVQFTRYGYQTYVIVSLKNLRRKVNLIRDIADVVVFNTESRADPPELAYQKCYDIAKIIKEIGAEIIYKKVDSTMRGNIGSEIDGLMDGLDRKYAFFTSAFPLNKRIIIGGYLLVNGSPINLTPFSIDPISPVKEPNVLELIKKQSKRAIKLISYDIVRHGVNSISSHVNRLLKELDEAIFVFDAVTHENLYNIAKATVKYTDKGIFSGSAGLARELPKALGGEIKELEIIIQPKGKYFFVLSGSANPLTVEQVDIAVLTSDLYIIEINARGIIEDSEKEMKRVLDEFKKRSKENYVIGFRTVRSHKDLEESWELGRKIGLSKHEVSRRIAKFVGELARIVYDSVNGDVSGFLLTGGDIAIKVCEKLGIEALEIIGEIDPGVPISRALSSKGNKDLLVITKAGGFGEKDTVSKSIDLVTKARS